MSISEWFCAKHTDVFLLKRESANQYDIPNGRFWCKGCLREKADFANTLNYFQKNWKPMRRTRLVHEAED
jgi:hypothetical protein